MPSSIASVIRKVCDKPFTSLVMPLFAFTSISKPLAFSIIPLFAFKLSLNLLVFVPSASVLSFKCLSQ